MSDAITQATMQVTELAKFRTFLAVRGMERFVLELGEGLEEAGISPADRRGIFARLASEAEQARAEAAQKGARTMKWFIDGDQIVVTKDDFENLQESPAVFVPADSEAGQAIKQGGVLALPIGDLAAIKKLLDSGGGVRFL